MPPSKRDGGKYQWELDRLPETGTLVYQIIVYNNDTWTASPIQFLRLPELGWWNATIPATMWTTERGEVNDMPLLVFRLPENISDPRCKMIYLARGIPGSSTGSMQRIDDGIFTYQREGDAPGMEFFEERLDRGVAFAYVTSRDEEGALRRSEVFMFTFGGGVSLDLEADYAQPSPGPVPICECVLGFPILLGCGLLLSSRRGRIA